MMNLYLNTKQILTLTLPIVVVSYLYLNPKDSSETIQSAISVVSEKVDGEDYTKLAQESIKKSYHKSFDKIKVNYDLSSKNLYEMDKEFSSWVIAYFYKEVSIKEQKNKKEAGNMVKMAKLQKMVDDRNKDIKNTLGKSNSIEDEEISMIWDIIKSRNITSSINKKNIEESISIDLSKYELQMILHSKKNPTVIDRKSVV